MIFSNSIVIKLITSFSIIKIIVITISVINYYKLFISNVATKLNRELRRANRYSLHNNYEDNICIECNSIIVKFLQITSIV